MPEPGSTSERGSAGESWRESSPAVTDPLAEQITYVCGGCGEHLANRGFGHSCAATIVGLRAGRDRYRDALEEIAIAEHTSEGQIALEALRDA